MSAMKNFDDQFKKSFDNYLPDVPLHIWDNIEARRKRKKPAGFWWNRKNILGAAILLIALGGGGLLLIKNQGSHLKIISRENTILQQQGTETAVPPVVVKDNSASTSQQKNSNSATIDNSNASITGSSTNKYLSGTNKENKEVKNNMAGNRLAELPATPKSVADKNHRSINPGENNINKRSTGKFAPPAIEAEIAVATDVSGITGNSTETSRQQGFLTSRLLYGAEKLSAASLAWNGKKTDFKIIQIPGCPPSEKDAAGNKQYWEVYAGPDYAFKKYNDTANSALLEKRKASTSFQSAFSAGIRYTRVFSNGMSLRGGINYSQINEKFSYIQSNVVQLTYEINQAGDTTSSYYVRGTRYKNSYNHYRTLDIPILIGYELGNGRLHANINAGAVINIYSWLNGETLDTSFAPVSFSSGKSNSPYQYKTNAGIGFMGAVSFYYKLNERLHLLAEPYFRYNFSPMNKETLSIQEKFTSIGLRLGVRIDL